MSDSLRSYGLQPTRLISPWNFLGKNTEVGCHFLLQGNLPLGIEPVSPTLQADSLPSEPPRKPNKKREREKERERYRREWERETE